MTNQTQTFGQKLAIGYAVMVLLTTLISVAAIYALRATVASKDRVINENAQVVSAAQRLDIAMWERIAAVRGYVLQPDESQLELLKEGRSAFAAEIGKLRSVASSDEERRLIEEIGQVSDAYRDTADAIINEARVQGRAEPVLRLFTEKLQPLRKQFTEKLARLIQLEERLLGEGKQAATDAASNAIALVVSLAVAAVLFAIVIATVLTRTLGRQIGAAVGHVQSSSAELQAAASQQATGAKEQASAMTEITTTIGELVATSRQIAESAQRVAQIAEQTALAARSGDGTVEKGQESISGIRRQVDLVVNHMLDLGRKSQEIGAVLDIVSELAEQTNILAINATIEATGAGEAGRRFAVVADEIRKLADRVASSTKAIRSQIDEVRGAVNTTVMATEGGAKAVDAGARQFNEVAAAFQQIASLVGTTTDAAREIELSTKQQASAAEQVRVAVTDVAQATRETEASSGQTLQTASQLAGLSLELRRLIQPQST